MVLAACRFSGPPGGTGDDGGDDAPVDPDAAPAACDAAPTWEAGRQPARTIYVATTSTGTPDGSQQRPFTSISSAVTAAKAAGPGTRILLAGGIYPNGGATVSDLHGTATAPFWIEGPASAPRAVISGGAGGIHLIRPEYVVVRHVDIAGTTQASFNADDGGQGGIAHHLVVEDVTISSSAAAAFQLTGVDDVTIRASTASSCGRGVMMVGVHRASLARLALSGMTSYGVVLTGGSRDIEVRQSRLSSINNIGIWIGGSSDANEFRPPLSLAGNNFEVTDVRVFDNVFNDGATAIACNNCRRALVAHNELRGATQFVFRLSQDRTGVDAFTFGSPGEVRWIDNAIEAGPVTGALQLFTAAGGSTDLASCELSHNLWYRTNPPSTWMPTFPAPLTEPGGVYDRPSGYDASGRLCAGGGAIGAGVAVPEVTGTIDGTCRAQPPSIGPGERDPGC